VCVDSECRQVCLSNTDCDSGFYCEEGTCAGEAAVCGNGIVERGETCDNNCPISCSDDSACTRNEMTGSADTCDISCAFPPVDVCMGGDGCCPAMCSFANDSDCSDSCGDNIVDDDETCDGNCPTAADCVDTNACTADAILGSANNCSAECINTDIMLCIGGDGCCPGSCNQANDTDCIPNCGNSIVEDGEICDGDCPSYCSDTDVCTSDVLIGSSDDCDVECTHTDITDCSAGDGCCPSDCNAANDADSAATCGNDVIESGELCDGDCPETCSGADACMSYTLEGSECSRECVSAPVAGCPSLEMLYNGEAHFVRDAQGLGAGFNMHFLSIVEEADALSAYYINGYTLDGVTRYATGLATSTDGLSFQDQGIVLDIGGSWERNFDAVTDLSHLVGRADSGDWSANTIDDSAGFLAYGPYQTGWSGSNVASFQLMVDFNADHVHALSIQVYNSTDDVMLASQDIYRDDFTATMTYQIFNLGF
ncbi:hypothetical protein KAI87_15635, partial [Myxococcota bacterium]|nr:hypothetical protein [Myxococcota bacterium]